MGTTEVIERVARDHYQMQSRLEEWEDALAELTSGSFFDSQQALERLRRLVPFFEREVPEHFQAEENDLFPALSKRNTRTRTTLAHFSGQHKEFRERWHEFRQELIYCDAVGDSQRLCQLGTALIHLLRQHIESEEEEVMPRAEKH